MLNGVLGQYPQHPYTERGMESYTYVNIFETKGLEYLLLICFLVMFVLLIRYLSHA
ncbi:unnamed protein product, partial [marine sediment metagenome]